MRRLITAKVGPGFDEGVRALRNTISPTYRENMLQVHAPGYQQHLWNDEGLLEFDVFSNSEPDAVKQFEDVCLAIKESGSVVGVRSSP